MSELSPDTKIEAASDDELQLVVFNVGSEEFGVGIMNVQEIIRMTTITKIPQAPGYIRGIINLRGRIIVVINLNDIMGMAGIEKDDNTRIIVTDLGGVVVGFVVDAVSEVIRLSEKNIEPAPAIIANKMNTEFIPGVGKMDKRLLILLDLKKVLGEDELRSINDMSIEAEGTAM